jgi:hypothetical protein
MNGTTVFRLISLIPDRSLRAQTGTHFRPDDSARMALIRRFLHWMGPLDTLSREDQQVLGLRGGGRSLEDGDTEGEEIDPRDEVAEPIRLSASSS